MYNRGSFLLLLTTILLLPSAVLGQRVVTDDEWCDQGRSQTPRACEVREYTLSPMDLIRVDAAPNGGIQVEGWDRNEISLRARVSAWSRDGDPQALVGRIQVQTGGTISADGPDTRNREGWDVSFRLMVPRSANLDLESMNGGIRIAGVSGDMDFRTMNGGVTLEDVGGNVRGRTTNGGVNVRLRGSEWAGEGLDVQTTNGGVNLTLPESYRATLETGTVNGSLDTEIPMTVRGRLRSNRITTELNGGGPRVRVTTTNGAIRIRTG